MKHEEMSLQDLDSLVRTAPSRIPIEWMCQDCHVESNTMMNVGFRKRGVCQKCGNTNVFIYQIDNGDI